MAAGYHFYQRVDRHRDELEDREKEVERAVRRAVKGIAKHVTIRVDDSHFHVFASFPEKKRYRFVSRIREETSKLNVRWDAKHFVMPVSSVRKEYVNKLLEDMHRHPLI